MAEYNNLEGFEVSNPTKDRWTYIVKKGTDHINFVLPPLFKKASPFINLYVFGFILIFVIEGLVTYFVAYTEGVPVEVIVFLIFIDIFFAYFPHFWDGSICKKKNEIFVAEYSVEFNRKEKGTESDEEFKRVNIASKGKLRKEISNLTLLRTSAYFFIVLSGVVKIYLFFQTYPFYDTYQAYIIFVAYSMATILHILCTGNVIMYLRFTNSLKKDQKVFQNSQGHKNSYPDNYYESFINTDLLLEEFKDGNQNQSIFKKDIDGKYYLQTKGLLFDEELNVLINKQINRKEQLSVAVAGKKLQLNMLKTAPDRRTSEKLN